MSTLIIKNNFLGIIPARGGSKRIPRKNIVSFGGQPLIKYTIDSALDSELLSRFIVSTDDEEIASIARKAGAEVPFLRPPELANDLVNSIQVMQHAIDFHESNGGMIVDFVVLMQPTSPFRNAHHIDTAIDLFISSGAESLTSVCQAREHPFYAWKGDEFKIEPFFSYEQQELPRQKLPSAYMENGAIYIAQRSLIDRGTFYGDKVVPLIMDDLSSTDIDTPQDLLWAEFLFEKAYKGERENISNYRQSG